MNNRKFPLLPECCDNEMELQMQLLLQRQTPTIYMNYVASFYYINNIQTGCRKHTLFTIGLKMANRCIYIREDRGEVVVECVDTQSKPRVYNKSGFCDRANDQIVMQWYSKQMA